MSDWRLSILKEFAPQVFPLTVVADPDGILLEERILQQLSERGFELMPFEDSITFRYLYESKYRARWERDEHTDLVLLVRNPPESFRSLPYDIVSSARQLSFSLADIFPNLSYPIVAALAQSDLDGLYEAQRTMNPGRLGENSTKDFILHHVFQVAPEQIKQPSDLLRVLARQHYTNRQMPNIFSDRFVQLLRDLATFSTWPLESIVPDRSAFLGFLQERWSVFLSKLAGPPDAPKEDVNSEAPSLRFAGPADIPFDHPDVSVYIDSMFIDGLLIPIAHPQSESLRQNWVRTGLIIDRHADRKRRLERLLQSVEQNIPLVDERHRAWLTLAPRWAEVVAMATDFKLQLESGIQAKIQNARSRIDSAFLEWIQIHYATLHNQPVTPPAMLHHVARGLSRYVEDSPQHKAALIVVDGLALDQWVVMRNVLREQRPALKMAENTVFAWVPTLTSVSRQSIFAGKPPVFFPASIYNTAKEGSLWVQFWTDRGLHLNQVAYLKAQGEGSLEAVQELVTSPAIRVAGIVVDKVDRIMHGMELGTAGMHNQVRQFSEQGYMARLIDLLLSHGFRVTLTSDHGNIEARGCGRSTECAVAEMRGQRVRIYRNARLRDQVKARFVDSIEWASIGLPDDFLPLIAPNRTAFVRAGDNLVGHGGISIEEVIVPLVEIG